MPRHPAGLGPCLREMQPREMEHIEMNVDMNSHT